MISGVHSFARVGADGHIRNEVAALSELDANPVSHCLAVVQ